jgi:hypothetical protein
MRKIQYEISFYNAGDWTTLGNVMYDSIMKAENALYAYYDLLDYEKKEYFMDDYHINEIEL